MQREICRCPGEPRHGRDLALWEKHRMIAEATRAEDDFVDLPPALAAARDLVTRLKARQAYLDHIRADEERAYQ